MRIPVSVDSLRYSLGTFLFGVALFLLATTTGQAVAPDHAEKMQKGTRLFQKSVRSLLVENCLECHGGDAVKGEFDLSTREGLLRGGKHGDVVRVKGEEGGLLLDLIQHRREPHMPKDRGKLSPDAIEDIRNWISLGAPYDKPLVLNLISDPESAQVTAEDRNYWAFQPLKEHLPPSIGKLGWGRTAVDAFVLGAMQKEGLRPNPDAKARDLVRRLFFDLVGMPPSPDQVAQFLDDPSDEAYEELVDELLNDTRYGERWGRHWLDVARFGESHGFEQDYNRNHAYHYRDFVIKALNSGMPYDQFVRWQLAGDEFEPDNPLALMATGFLGGGVFPTQITKNEVERTRYDALDDMAATVGTAMLGLTVGCARCHDHKFDPISAHDYYRFVSTFTTTVRSDVELNLDPEGFKKRRAPWKARFDAAQSKLQDFEDSGLPDRFSAWLKNPSRPPSPDWVVLKADSLTSQAGADFKLLEDGSYLVSGQNGKFDTYTFVVNLEEPGVTAIRLEALADKSMKRKGPGRASNGNFALSDVKVAYQPTKGGASSIPVKLLRASATFEQTSLPVAAIIDDDARSAWAIDPKFGENHAALIEFATPIDFEDSAVLTVTLSFNNNTGHNIGRPRFSISRAVPPLKLDGPTGGDLVAKVNHILDRPVQEWSAGDRSALLSFYKTTDARWRQLNSALQEVLKVEPKPDLTKVMITSEGVKPMRHHTQGADFFKETYFLKRGDLSQKQGVAAPGFLQVLMSGGEKETKWKESPPDGSKTSYRRRSLANWITDVDSGAGALLARVLVNRLWQHHIGRGIVATPSDFGRQGNPPTHPELLDWLALKLISEGWRLKPIHKLIVMSSVYRQSTAEDPHDRAIDPENRLRWKRDRVRLQAEAIRDSMLWVSGTLDSTMFGKGSLDESMNRRSIYFMTKRSKLIPSMQLFDAPSSLSGLGQRGSTTIAPQALMFLNGKEVRRYAVNLAKRLEEEADFESSVKRGFLLCLTRSPSAGELKAAVAFLKEQEKSYSVAGAKDPRSLALTDFCQTLMGLNEFIYSN